MPETRELGTSRTILDTDFFLLPSREQMTAATAGRKRCLPATATHYDDTYNFQLGPRKVNKAYLPQGRLY